MTRPFPLKNLPLAATLVALVALLILAGASVWTWQLVVNESQHTHAGEQSDGTWYTCGMHPQILEPQPGLCPICHMNLEPIDPARFAGEIAIDPVMVQNIGVRIAQAERGPYHRQLRALGRVETDEQRLRDIVVRSDAYVEALHADVTGMIVEQGQVIAELHSPAVVSAAHELVVAARAPGSSDATSRAVLTAARDKLRIRGVGEAWIDEVAATGDVPRTYPVHSPITGVVQSIAGREGHWMREGEHLLDVADLSQVWVIASVYESQLPLVQTGQSATMHLPYHPGRTFEGEVSYVYPTLDERTREGRVRLVFDNPDPARPTLKPGMFADVQLHVRDDVETTLVPAEAVIDTGERQVLFVSLGAGRFEPRHVTLGRRTGDGRVQVLGGVEPGEHVVVSGQFLLDSESRTREALLKMIDGESAADQLPTVDTADAPELTTLPDAAAAAITELLDAYLTLGNNFAHDRFDNTRDHARRLAAAFDDLRHVTFADDEHFWHRHADDAQAEAERADELAQAGDLADARIAYAHLSESLERLLTATGLPADAPTLDALVCGMVDTPQRGLWLQPAGDALRNPYMGADMLSCNITDQRRRLPHATNESPQTSTTP